MELANLAIDHGIVVTLDPERRVIKDGSVVIKDNKIVAMGKTKDLQGKYVVNKNIDATGKVVMPGLDVHLHNVQQLSRGLADDVDLITWIYDRIYPYEAVLTDEDTYLSALLGCIEMIRTGTTCASDPGGYRMDNVGRAYEECGLRGVISWAAMDQWSDDRLLPEDLPGKTSTAEAIYQMERLVKTWHNTANGRIRASYALRVEPNVTETLFKKTKELADRDGVMIQMHAAVNKDQVEWVREKTGRTTIDYMNSLGILGPNWLLIHMAVLTDEEVEMLKENDVKLSHNPGASVHGTYGAISVGKFPELIQKGVTVGMGCDANSANNSLDMFRTMYQVATLHKEVRLVADLISPEKALEMATIDGARAIMWDDEIGSLEVGKKADVIIINLNMPNLVPTHDFSLIPNLVYCGDGYNVETTIVDGQILMENREFKTIDVGDILERSQFAVKKILERLPYRLKPRWNFI